MESRRCITHHLMKLGPALHKQHRSFYQLNAIAGDFPSKMRGSSMRIYHDFVQFATTWDFQSHVEISGVKAFQFLW